MTPSAAAWRVTVVIENASGVPVPGARLARRVWAGGTVQQFPEVTVTGATFSFDVPGETQSIVCEVRHPRHATLVMNAVRGPGESVWRWTNATRRVRTSGSDVTIVATLGRVRPAPLGHVPEPDLDLRAEALRPRLDEAAQKNAELRRRRRPATEPNYLPLDLDHRTALITRDRLAYRSQATAQRAIGAFHVAAAPFLSATPEAEGWGRFANTSHGVDPVREGRLYLVEYGEVSDEPSAAPRFSVGLWVPHRLHAETVTALDFVVWLHPATNDRLNLPQVDYPFRAPYPYGIIVGRSLSGGVIATQRFLDIPIFHLLRQHFLAYQLAAARRDAVIVIPVAPSSHFAPFEAPATLMRLLRELCLWIPRDVPRGAEAAVHPPAPVVGRVAVSAFSVSVPRLHTLMRAALPDSRYAAPHWWGPGQDDAAAFDRVWKEQWAIDGVAGGFPAYADAAAVWLQQYADRRLRIYKSEFTGGWDPLARRPGAWASLTKGATSVRRESGRVWALSAGDSQGRWQAVSLADAFVLGPESGPGAALEPRLLPSGAHELMPRICFGHAAVTSGLTAAR
ncbi:hypothetical protein [Nonomuraea sp. NPDC050643]|uniref:hypothetical protein n=1 Tax=Nonomuraea sp. NPDC050643 TaxID=3155660 RepID=UPI0033CC22DA